MKNVASLPKENGLFLPWLIYMKRKKYSKVNILISLTVDPFLRNGSTRGEDEKIV